MLCPPRKTLLQLLPGCIMWAVSNRNAYAANCPAQCEVQPGKCRVCWCVQADTPRSWVKIMTEELAQPLPVPGPDLQVTRPAANGADWLKEHCAPIMHSIKPSWCLWGGGGGKQLVIILINMLVCWRSPPQATTGSVVPRLQVDFHILSVDMHNLKLERSFENKKRSGAKVWNL